MINHPYTRSLSIKATHWRKISPWVKSDLLMLLLTVSHWGTFYSRHFNVPASFWNKTCVFKTIHEVLMGMVRYKSLWLVWDYPLRNIMSWLRLKLLMVAIIKFCNIWLGRKLILKLDVLLLSRYCFLSFFMFLFRHFS